MKDTDIILICFENGRRKEKKLDRKSVIAVFKGLREGFDGNNEISRILVNEILSNVDEIIINKDNNATQDIPSIVFNTDENRILLKVMRCHKIVWAIFDKYCS